MKCYTVFSLLCLIIAGCGENQGNSGVEGIYTTQGNNDTMEFVDTLIVSRSSQGGDYDHTVLLKTWITRNGIKRQKPQVAYQGNFDRKTNILTTNDPAIVYNWDPATGKLRINANEYRKISK